MHTLPAANKEPVRRSAIIEGSPLFSGNLLAWRIRHHHPRLLFFRLFLYFIQTPSPVLSFYSFSPSPSKSTVSTQHLHCGSRQCVSRPRRRHLPVRHPSSSFFNLYPPNLLIISPTYTYRQLNKDIALYCHPSKHGTHATAYEIPNAAASKARRSTLLGRQLRLASRIPAIDLWDLCVWDKTSRSGTNRQPQHIVTHIW